MNVFELDRAMIEEYAAFSRSFTKIRAQDIRAQIDDAYATRRYWPEPILQINPHFRRDKSVADLVKQGVLHPSCNVVFRDWELRTHQVQAVHIARAKRSFVVTTGTGSGKSVCFFMPIIDAVLRAKEQDKKKRTRVIIVYPMNALANSQVGELDRYFDDVADPHRVSYARYTGQESQEERKRVAANPPDILLTNFMMLELLLTRQEELDQRVIGNCEGLDFLVLDELHTYRGRQGADVAMLVRRLRQRLAANKEVLCIGTSATMSSEGTDRAKEVVSRVASTLFSTTIDHNDVVTETLERRTDPMQSAETVKTKLAAAIGKGVANDATDTALFSDPLAIWAETTLGIEPEKGDGPWVRATPSSLSDAAKLLMRDSGVDVTASRQALEGLMLVASRTEKARSGKGSEAPFFGVRLHQFISGAGRAHATIEPIGVRRVVLDGQVFLPEGDGTKRLYALHFCHNCGQEHMPVWLCDYGGRKRLEARPIEDIPLDDDHDDARRFGFFMPAPDDIEFQGADVDYPETWTETTKNGIVRVISAYRKLKHVSLQVEATGAIGAAGGVQGWFQPGNFRFCATCGELSASKGADLYRLAGLSAEGRSSATTVLVASILKWMNDPESGIDNALKRKVLGFTDNRQDAALQAGHFNDFVFVSLLRAAVYSALREAGDEGLDDGRLGEAVQAALGFTMDHVASAPEWLNSPDTGGPLLLDAERALREVLTHRFWVDQQRGWRVTNPNLERLHLLKVEYKGLAELAADQAKFDGAHIRLSTATPERRRLAYELLFDHMRKALAVDTVSLEQARLEEVQRRANSLLKAPWNLPEDKPRVGSVLILDRTGRQVRAEEEVFRIRGGATSALGRAFRSSRLWGARLSSADYDQILRHMLAAAEGSIILRRSHFFRENVDNWVLHASALRFRVGEGKPEGVEREANQYFLNLYRALADVIGKPQRAIFGFEAREHTAQVESKVREIREARFRSRKDDLKFLAEPETLRKLNETVDTSRFLPVMFCSPTMELGVDIAELDLVYLRNVPPTAANYAQRSGRAGRGGQPALIVTYCAALSPHDQWFFGRPADTVKGVVKAPTIDLANQDMIESHLQAEWLAETKTALSPKIAEVLNLDVAGRPLAAEVEDSIHREGAEDRALKRAMAILSEVYAGERKKEMTWVGDLGPYCKRIVAKAPERFDATFDRWRTLFDAAERQVEEAHVQLKKHTLEPRERRQFEAIRGNAEKQMDLLRGGGDDKLSDFYTYRFLATEGFLPGYNFPRLPLVAFVTTGRGRTSGRTTIQRPRFVGISEFGPNSLIYHEGRGHRVRRVILKSGDQRDNGELATSIFHICERCGAAHSDPRPDLCHSCGHTLADARDIRSAYRIEQVETVPAERITANDEERRRQGFELRTVFEWPLRDKGRRDIRQAEVMEDGGVVASMTFGPATTIRRFNVGLRRRDPQNGDGFSISPRTGYWSRSTDDGDANDAPDPERVTPQRIVPYVEDRKNALLFTPVGEFEGAVMADLQYAIIRGLEVEFQLEEGEVLGEALPERSDRRSILIYEAAEGGAGVLSRIVAEPEALSRAMMKALETCHFDVSRFEAVGELHDVADSKCVAGCYRCLLSYFNQPDHALIDRRKDEFRTLLARLARSHVEMRSIPEPAPVEDEPGDTPRDPFLAAVMAHGLQPFDPKPLDAGGHSLPYVWRAARTVAIPLGSPFKVVRSLADLGLAVIDFDPERPGAAETMAKLTVFLTGAQE